MKNILAAAFAALWLLDTAATVSFVGAQGIYAEANPFMRALIDGLGLGAFALLKAGLLAAWLSMHRHAHVWVHWFLVAVMVPVAYVAVTFAWWLS